MELRNRLREVRQASQLTQEALAARVGVTRQSIIAIEQGRYGPSVKLALELAGALSVRVEDLFALEGHRERSSR
jgi:putative transcriptional regulator